MRGRVLATMLVAVFLPGAGVAAAHATVPVTLKQGRAQARQYARTVAFDANDEDYEVYGCYRASGGYAVFCRITYVTGRHEIVCKQNIRITADRQYYHRKGSKIDCSYDESDL